MVEDVLCFLDEWFFRQDGTEQGLGHTGIPAVGTFDTMFEEVGDTVGTFGFHHGDFIEGTF